MTLKVKLELGCFLPSPFSPWPYSPLYIFCHGPFYLRDDFSLGHFLPVSFWVYFVNYSSNLITSSLPSLAKARTLLAQGLDQDWLVYYLVGSCKTWSCKDIDIFYPILLCLNISIAKSWNYHLTRKPIHPVCVGIVQNTKYSASMHSYMCWWN